MPTSFALSPSNLSSTDFCSQQWYERGLDTLYMQDDYDWVPGIADNSESIC